MRQAGQRHDVHQGQESLGLLRSLEFKEFRRVVSGVSENWGTLFWGPYNEDPTI